MAEKMKTFLDNYQTDIEFKIKVIIGHILVAKVFLDPYFEKYYINFFKETKFDQESFKKSIGYIDIMFNGENYKDRYSLFEENQNNIIHLLLSQDEISQTIKESVIGDIINIIAKKDENGDILLTPYDLNFLDNEDGIKKVQNGINDFIIFEIAQLKKTLYSLKIKEIKSELIRKTIKIIK